METLFHLDYKLIDILEWTVDQCFGTQFSSVELPMSLFESVDIEALMDVLEHFDSYLGDGTRAKSAAYFTPNWLSELMVEYLIQEDDLKNKTVIDIACGSGNLLKAYVLFACSDGEPVDEVLSNVYGVDINSESVRALKLNIFVGLVSEGYKSFDVNLMNLYVCDSLIDFNPSFQFDYCIGNPPYIGEKNNKDLFRRIKENSFGKRHYEGKMDYFYFFIYKSFDLMKKSGRTVYLTTNYYLKADGAKKLRTFLYEEECLRGLIDFGEQRVFKDAKGQHNLISILSKDKGDTVYISHYPDVEFVIEKPLLFSGVNNNIQMYTEKLDYEIMSKFREKSNNCLSEFFSVNQGIVSGADKLSKKNSGRLSLPTNTSIFVLNENEIGEFESRNVKRFYKNSDIERYTINVKSSKYILYDSLSDDHVLKHLLPFKEILELRREVKMGSRKWYELTWPRVKSIFEDEKIVVPQRSLKNAFAYNKGEFYASADVYYIQKLGLGHLSLKYLLGYLNSPLMYYYLYHGGKRKGDMLELYATPLKELPIVVLDPPLIADIESKVDEMIRWGFDRKKQVSIDRYFYEYLGLNHLEIERIEEQFYE